MTDGRKTKPSGPSAVVGDDDDEDEEDEEFEGPTLESQFAAFAKPGNPPDDPGTLITLTQIEAWMTQAGLIQVRKLTRTDVGVCYFQFKKYRLDVTEFKTFLQLLAIRKKISVSDLQQKLVDCGPPPPEDEAKRIV